MFHNPDIETQRNISPRFLMPGEKSVAENLEAVLKKIKDWHQESIAGYKISFRGAQGLEHQIEWDGNEATARGA
jgi:hypothetical protein